MEKPSRRGIDFAFATPEDEEEIRRLLREHGLPDEDVGRHLEHFIVARNGGKLAGVVGLEHLGEVGLLRSLAVSRSRGRRGLGTALYHRIAAHAWLYGIARLYLLTTTAEGFFSRLGFTKLAREELPEPVRRTEEFRGLCPSNAVCMQRRIDDEFRHAGTPRADQVETFHRTFTELVRKYQFRDRQQLVCHGLSVTQCHALEVLGEGRALRMGQLAARLHLSISTMTRITGQLIAKELAERWADDKDRRGCWVALSKKGKALHAVIKKEILARESLLLERISAPARQPLIDGLVDLSRALDDWRERAGAHPGATRAATSAEQPGRRGSGLE